MIKCYNPNENPQSVETLVIKLQDESVVRENPRRLAPLERRVVKDQVQEWLDKGVVRSSYSPYASAVVVVPKKNGTYRVCIDYRELNKKMIRDKYPIPNIEDQIEQLAESRVFTTLDLENSYFHVTIDEDSRKFTAFVT